MLLKVWYFLIVCLLSLLAFQYYQRQNLIFATTKLCKLVNENFYEPSDSLQAWYEECQRLAKKISSKTSKAQVIRSLQAHLASLGVSHLELWSPSEMSQMWLGEDLDTGIRIKQMDNYWIVTDVIADSFSEGKIQVGDEVIKLGDKTILFSNEIEKFKGKVHIWRDGEEKVVDVIPTKLTYPYQPSLHKLDFKKYKIENAAVLKLKSFTPVYFYDEQWLHLMHEAEPFDRLVIDLRGNSGGDFVVMQKVLSSFLCEPTDIGYLLQPRRQAEATTASFLVDMDGFMQIETLRKSSLVELRTYDDYPCFSGEVSVVIDDGTSSTAEIFSEAIKLRKGTRLYGQTTSGAVLLAIWYPTAFGRQHSVSIPVAVYKNWKDQMIEGEGVRPNKFLQYDVRSWRNGVDNWLQEALRD